MIALFKQLARQVLPKMPPEIFDLWLDQRIENNGWPPIGPTWHTVLGEIPFSQWQQFSWSEQNLDLRTLRVTRTTSSLLTGLVGSVFQGEINQYTNMLGDSKIKVGKILKYVTAHQKLPSKLIFVRKDGAYELIDGCHRMATYVYYDRRLGADSPLSPIAAAWIGSKPPAG